MTQEPTSRARLATYRSRGAGFLRRHWGVMILVGVIAGTGVPAAQAANGNPVILGVLNQATGSTEVSTAAGDGLDGFTTDAGSQWAGVYGRNFGAGNGVEGNAAAGGGNGVYGHTTSSTA